MKLFVDKDRTKLWTRHTRRGGGEAKLCLVWFQVVGGLARGAVRVRVCARCCQISAIFSANLLWPPTTAPDPF